MSPVISGAVFLTKKKKKNPRMYFFHIFEKIAQFNIMLNY